MSLELKKEVAGNQKITIKAVFGKTQGPCTVYPMQEGDSGKILGLPAYSEEEKRKLKKVITPDTYRVLNDGDTFDLGNEVDAIDWSWISTQPIIAPNRKAAHEDPRVMFYVDDPEEELNETIKTADKVFEALKLIADSSETKRAEICRLIGQETKYFKPLDIEHFLKEKAMKDPDSIIKVYNDKYAKVRLFLYKLLDAGIIVKDSDGIYKYGTIIIGVKEDAVLHYLGDPNNKDLVRQWSMILNPEPITAPSALDEVVEKKRAKKS